ncbi:phage protein GemA/Gp16 family protein, partial [Methylobacterium sp. sgz302541]|uniref:phage protein GemA/Gp16 family protein n=1 Tax=unclassified Methylobacterium TaxID=2615210 RepID=UPI003D33F63F
MIRPAQLKLIGRAREAVAADPGVFAGILRRCGGVDSVEALTAQGFARLMDHFTVIRFECRQRPILSAATRKLIEATARELGLTPHVYAADLRGYGGVADLRDLGGRGLIDLLSRWEQRGLDVAAFVAARRTITPAKVRLIQVARKCNAMDEKRYYAMLQGYGGVVSANDLDGRGFDLCMAFLEAEGFEREPLAVTKPGFGRRAGFASPEQVELIRALWREWTGPSAESDAAVEAGLNAWLERYHRASSLRFLTMAGAGKVITALRAMKYRTREKQLGGPDLAGTRTSP